MASMPMMAKAARRIGLAILPQSSGSKYTPTATRMITPASASTQKMPLGRSLRSTAAPRAAASSPSAMFNPTAHVQERFAPANRILVSLA